jgi:hypothetical protein
MALSVDDVQDIQTYQLLLTTLVTILDKETTIASENRGANGVSDANITELNTTVTNILDAINAIIAPSV